MSVIVSYTVLDLLRTTENLMNILYESNWDTEIDNDSQDYLFTKIKNMHMKILNDSEVDNYTAGASQLFDVANRLVAIENALTGSTEPVSDVVTVRKCILRTERIIRQMSGDKKRQLCVIC